MSTPAQSDPVAAANVLINQILGSSNPREAFEQILRSSPQAQNVMNLINQYGNGDPKTAFMNYAASQGRTAAAQQTVQMFGLK